MSDPDDQLDLPSPDTSANTSDVSRDAASVEPAATELVAMEHVDAEVVEDAPADGEAAHPDAAQARAENGSVPPVRYAPRTALDAAAVRMSSAFHWALLIVCSLTLAASIVLDVQEANVTSPVLSLLFPGSAHFGG